MPNAIVPMVGLEKLYVAALTKDDNTSVTYDVPRYLAGIKEIGIKPKVSSDEFYAENQLWMSESTLSSVDIEIDITDLTQEDEAFLLGHKISADGGIIRSANDKAPDVAILFQANKGNGKSRFVVLYRGNFSLSDEAYKGKEGKSNMQSKKLKATFAPLKNNKMWSYKIDEEQGMDATKFFGAVPIPVPKAAGKA